MYGCQNWQCSAGDSSEPTAKKYKKTTYEKITNDGVQVENLDPTGLRKILLYVCTVTAVTVVPSYPQFFLPSSNPAAALNSKVCKQLSAHV